MSDTNEWIVIPPHKEFPSAPQVSLHRSFQLSGKKNCIKRTNSSGIAAVGCTEGLVGIHSNP